MYNSFSYLNITLPFDGLGKLNPGKYKYKEYITTIGDFLFLSRILTMT